jgi:hypothetical protein
MAYYNVENTIGKEVVVKLGGEIVSKVIEADTTKGYLLRYKSGPDGNFVVDTFWNPIVERLEGEVEVEVNGPE